MIASQLYLMTMNCDTNTIYTIIVAKLGKSLNQINMHTKMLYCIQNIHNWIQDKSHVYYKKIAIPKCVSYCRKEIQQRSIL